MKKKNIAVIPARCGSKRIHKKNIIDFFGKPLMCWTIEAALSSGIFDKVLVSTDSEEIASIARNFGAEVPFLRTKYCGDSSLVSSATIGALEQVNDLLHEEYQTVVQLMPNCPLRKKEHITRAYKNFLKTNTSFQISCFKFGWMNPWWAFKLNNKLRASPLFPKAVQKQSQKLPDLYCPTGAIWIANIKALKKYGSFYGKAYTFYPMDWTAAVDIDNMDDIEVARMVFAGNIKKTKPA